MNFIGIGDVGKAVANDVRPLKGEIVRLTNRRCANPLVVLDRLYIGLKLLLQARQPVRNRNSRSVHVDEAAGVI